jgi:hypothetical protein
MGATFRIVALHGCHMGSTFRIDALNACMGATYTFTHL